MNCGQNVVSKAAWVEDGMATFLRDTRVSPGTKHQKLSGGSLVSNEYNNASATLSVPTVDFSRWLLSQTSQGDHVTVKMDIEGAEFKVLPKMVADGSLRRVHTLIIEVHDYFYTPEQGGAGQDAARYLGNSDMWRRLREQMRAVAPRMRIFLQK